MSRQPARGKRRAEPSKKRRRGQEAKSKGGKRADRPREHEGLTPEFLQQLRELDTDTDTGQDEPAVRIGMDGLGVREVLAGIDGDLRGDQEYLQALGRLAYG